MRRRLFPAIAFLLLAGFAGPTIAPPPAVAQPVSEADRTAIVDVISAQMAAFQGDRAVEAFGYASPSIQRMFGTPAEFMMMVQRGYRPVYRPQSVEFLEMEERNGRLVQPVLIQGQEGRLVVADYFMERQENGDWRIDGCVLREPDDAAV